VFGAGVINVIGVVGPETAERVKIAFVEGRRKGVVGGADFLLASPTSLRLLRRG